MVHAEDGNAGVVQLLQLRVDRGVAEDRDDGVDVLSEEDVVVLRVQGVVAVAVGGQHGAAELLDLVDRTLEGLAVPEVLRADDGDADRLARERLAGVDALAVRGGGLGRDGRATGEGQARRHDDRRKGEEGLSHGGLLWGRWALASVRASPRMLCGVPPGSGPLSVGSAPDNVRPDRHTMTRKRRRSRRQ